LNESRQEIVRNSVVGTVDCRLFCPRCRSNTLSCVVAEGCKEYKVYDCLACDNIFVMYDDPCAMLRKKPSNENSCNTSSVA
jgi:hypothetical protein